MDKKGSPNEMQSLRGCVFSCDCGGQNLNSMCEVNPKSGNRQGFKRSPFDQRHNQDNIHTHITHTHTCMYVCMQVCMYIYVYTHTHTHTHTHRTIFPRMKSPSTIASSNSVPLMFCCFSRLNESRLIHSTKITKPKEPPYTPRSDEIQRAASPCSFCNAGHQRNS
jgi:hypothetical protein